VDGSFDTSFDDDGVQLTNLLVHDGAATGLAFADGKIVVTGHGRGQDQNSAVLLVARYNDNGELDSSFSDDGLESTNLVNSKATDVLIQPDGKIVIVGTQGEDLLLSKYQADGSLDTSFDDDGVLVLGGLNPVPGGTTAGKGILQPDGKLVVVATGGNDFVVLRVNRDGTLDTSWNGVGKTSTDLENTFNSSRALVLHDDGGVVVVGDSGGDWGLARYLGDPLLWQNQANRFDVNDDGNVVPLDVLRIINELNQPEWTTPLEALPAIHPDDAPYFDVDANGFLTPLDALAVINFLNELSSGGEDEGARTSRDSALDDVLSDLTFLLKSEER
jgi:uncharacterized delta-60 repeat protein